MPLNDPLSVRLARSPRRVIKEITLRTFCFCTPPAADGVKGGQKNDPCTAPAAGAPEGGFVKICAPRAPQEGCGSRSTPRRSS